jgi:hypothetical protein
LTSIVYYRIVNVRLAVAVQSTNGAATPSNCAVLVKCRHAMTDAAAGTAVPPSSLDSSDVDTRQSVDAADGTFGRQGRRNALADVLDETVTKTSPKSLIETLSKIQSIGKSSNARMSKAGLT